MLTKRSFGSPRSPSNNMSSTHEVSLLSTAVSVLDRSNYLVWKNQMRAWLRSKGLWQITNSNEKKFPELDQVHHLLLAKLIISNAWTGTTRMIKPMA